MPVSDSSSSRRLEDQLKLALARIDLLEQRVTALESERAESAFEIVSEAASVVLPIAKSSSYSSPTPVSSTAFSLPRDRQLILGQIGLWIRSCLDGTRRGLSGREKIKEGNRVYLVFRDRSGELHNPVGVFTQFAEVARIVKPTGDVGNSIFIGLPAEEDARLVAERAGFLWPENLTHGNY